MALNQKIIFLHSGKTFENLAAATAALNAVQMYPAQPVIAFYSESSTTKAISVIGKAEGKGASAYEVLATNADLSAALASITDLTGALDAHKKAIATDSALGHVKSGGDVTVNAETGVMTVPGLALKAPLASPEFSGTPTAPTPNATSSDTTLATTAFVQTLVASKIAASNALTYRGTIGTAGTVTTLPETPAVGDTYVAVAGCPQVNGENIEAGDMIICQEAKGEEAAAKWTVVNKNVDGVVVGPSSSVADRIATFSDASGKVIKDSGKTLGDFVEKTTKVEAGSGLKGGGALSGDVTISHGDKPTDGTAAAGGGTNKFVSEVKVDSFGHIASVSFGEVAEDDGKVLVDSDGTRDYMGNQFATAVPTADNTLAVTFAVKNHKVEATIVINEINGGTFGDDE